jgi:hypothetical protein
MPGAQHNMALWRLVLCLVAPCLHKKENLYAYMLTTKMDH